MKIIPIIIAFVMILSCMVFFTPTVEGETPPDRVSIWPDYDVDVIPFVVYPGVFATTSWFATDHGFDYFAEELAVNNSANYVIFADEGEWGELRFSFDNIILDWEYYEISVFVTKGANTFDYYYGIYDSVLDIGDLQYIYNANGQYHYSVHPGTGIPFTKDQVNDIQGKIVLYGSNAGQRIFTAFEITVTPVNYSAEDVSYILRPNEDSTLFTMEWDDKTPGTYIHDEINETNTGGDGETSYIFTTTSSETTNGTFGFENMPESANPLLFYSVELWIIAWTNVSIPEKNTISLSPYSPNTGFVAYNPAFNGENYPPGYTTLKTTPIKKNYTIDYSKNPITGTGWRVGDINNFVLWIGAVVLNEVGESVFITQIALKITVGIDYIGFISPLDDSFEPIALFIIWVGIIFIPGMILGNFSPFGFIAGSGIMLVMMAITYIDFYPIMVIGLMGMGIIVYKGG